MIEHDPAYAGAHYALGARRGARRRRGSRAAEFALALKDWAKRIRTFPKLSGNAEKLGK